MMALRSLVGGVYQKWYSMIIRPNAISPLVLYFNVKPILLYSMCSNDGKLCGEGSLPVDVSGKPAEVILGAS